MPNAHFPIVALFVPGDRHERFARAAAAGDVAILDLEDAVAPDRKPAAREHVRDALASGIAAWVRVNPLATGFGADDLRALAAHPPRAVVVPKVATADDVAAVRDAVGVPVIALVESVAGFAALDAIAASGALALAFGAFDLCAELGARPVPEVLAPLRSRLVLAARAAGIRALDTPFAGLDDDAGVAADAKRAVDFGFDGKLAIHPVQAGPIRAAFTPTEAELVWASGVIAAVRERGGAQRYEGMMIDEPLVRAAIRVLARGPDTGRPES